MFSLHFSPLYVTRAPRQLFGKVLGQEDCAGVVVTTSNYLDGERLAKQDGSAIAVGEW